MLAFMARASIEYGKPFSEFANMSSEDFVIMQAAQQLYGWPSNPIAAKSGDKFQSDAVAQLAGVFGAFGK